MHEFGLMNEMLELLAENAKQNNLYKISKVKLVVGKLSMAPQEALEMAFAALKREPLFSSDALLEIEEKEIEGLCFDCGQNFYFEDNYQYACPTCQGIRIKIVSGRELYIESYQGEEILP